jgi:hypothetical protein
MPRLAPFALPLVLAATPAHGGLGPVRIAGDDAELRLAFKAQLRFTLLERAGRETTDRILFPRIRPIVVGRFLDRRLRLKLQLNTGPTAIELVDLFADYAVLPELKIRVGQQKIPFTRHREGSFSQLPVVDWAHATRVFGAERQIGAQVRGGPGAGGGLAYAAGVFTGFNARQSFERGPWSIYDLPQPNPSALGTPAAPAAIHPELVARAGWRSGAREAEATSGRLWLAADLSAAWDLAPRPGRDFVARLAPEARLAFGGLSASAVAYLGLFEAAEDDSVDFGAYGLLGQVAYRWRDVELALRYDRAGFSDALRDDAPRLDAAGEAAGALERRDDLSAGLNVYLEGHDLEWQTDYTLILEARSGVERVTHRVRSQLQLAF